MEPVRILGDDGTMIVEPLGRPVGVVEAAAGGVDGALDGSLSSPLTANPVPLPFGDNCVGDGTDDDGADDAGDALGVVASEICDNESLLSCLPFGRVATCVPTDASVII
jgi:hypothetical protein